MRPPSKFSNSNEENSTNNQNSDRENRDRITQRLTENGAKLAFPIKIGKDIVRVVSRCEDAGENSNLDLSECQLIQVPDAVYHLMRNTELTTCDLSSNVISKIPPKFVIKFSLLTDLNLSHNHMSKLPDELCDLNLLQTLDISFNSFITLPPCVFKMKRLRELKASDNQIIEVDSDEMIVSDSLEVVDLRNNPLTPSFHTWIKNLKPQLSYNVLLSERELEDWEDLKI
ncbi:leucine-rich repeat-containing protein 20 isoform X1 [Culicoides brevitarsis]|uniref:leucine-rich repeat-containing protein 20 isoform X1 n=1 Tax=Culicoides brevitarsis TaxID=469753 RepID=UPI00307C9150